MDNSTKVIEFLVSDEAHGIRADKAFVSHNQKLSRSYFKKLMPAAVYSQVKDICKILNITYDYKLNSDDIENIKYDKKQSSNKYRFILLKNIGEPIICDDISKNDILSVI